MPGEEPACVVPLEARDAGVSAHVGVQGLLGRAEDVEQVEGHLAVVAFVVPLEEHQQRDGDLPGFRNGVLRAGRPWSCAGISRNAASPLAAWLLTVPSAHPIRRDVSATLKSAQYRSTTAVRCPGGNRTKASSAINNLTTPTTSVTTAPGTSRRSPHPTDTAPTPTATNPIRRVLTQRERPRQPAPLLRRQGNLPAPCGVRARFLIRSTGNTATVR